MFIIVRSSSFFAVCPLSVGAPDKVPSTTDDEFLTTSNAMTHLLINATFTCAGKINSWTYHRLRPGPKIFASVWRQEERPRDYYRLVGRNLLPPGDTGVQTVTVDARDRISVEKGDFIGFHYSNEVRRFNARGALAVHQRSSEDEDEEDEEERTSRRNFFFITLIAGYFDENFHVDMPHTFHTSDRRTTIMSPIITAHLEFQKSKTGKYYAYNVFKLYCNGCNVM